MHRSLPWVGGCQQNQRLMAPGLPSRRESPARTLQLPPRTPIRPPTRTPPTRDLYA